MTKFELEDHYDVEDISSLPDVQDLMRYSFGRESGFVRVNPPGFVYPAGTVDYLDTIRKFEVRDDDIWICTFPKCGTTWTQEMVWCLMNNLDYETSKSVDLDQRMVFLEAKAISKADVCRDTFKLAAEQPSPRIIKTHLPFMMLPDQIRTGEKTPKIIHVFRNSRDTCVSLYYHWRLLEGFTGDFDLWSRLFLDGLSGYYSPFWKHMESYYQSKYDNIIFLKYEEMKKDLRSSINSVSAFLGCKSYTEDEKNRLEEHLSVKNFKNSASLNKSNLVQISKDIGSPIADGENNFVRKGIVGDWVNYFTDEMAAKFVEKDDLLKQHLILKDD